VLRGNLYPLSVSAERVCQAASVVKVAKELKADAVAHGSTGAGNDQVRFDVAFPGPWRRSWSSSPPIPRAGTKPHRGDGVS